MKNFSDKKYVLMFILSVIFSVTMLIGGSYALIQRVLVGNNTYSFRTGDFLVEFTDNNNITLSNSLPVYDNVGMNSGDEFVFSVTNNGNYVSSYSVKIEDTSEDNLSDVIRYAVDYGNGYSYDNVHAYKNNKYIIQNKTLELLETDTYKLRFWMDIDADESYIYKEGSISEVKQFSAKVVIEATQKDYKYGVNILDTIYGQEDKEGLNAVNEDGLIYTDGKIREYRYSGLNVNNYVWFNCDVGHTSGSMYCEKWRIIGSFDNTYENGVGTYRMLKLVKDEALSTTQKYNSNTGNYGYYNGSSIQKYLNETYYNSLKDNVKDLIIKAKWNIGSVSNTNNGITNYALEKNKLAYDYVGLINASDFSYASDNTLWNTLLNTTTITSENNWLYEENNMIINTPNIEGTKIYYVSSNGLAEGNTTSTYKVRPVVYLKPDVSIINGYGTEEEPYQLSIKYPINYGIKTEIKAEEIMYNLNGGTGKISSTFAGENITSDIPTKEGYTFLGWSTNKDAIEAEYESGDAYNGPVGITLYAIWSANTYTVKFDKNQGSDNYMPLDVNEWTNHTTTVASLEAGTIELYPNNARAHSSFKVMGGSDLTVTIPTGYRVEIIETDTSNKVINYWDNAWITNTNDSDKVVTKKLNTLTTMISMLIAKNDGSLISLSDAVNSGVKVHLTNEVTYQNIYQNIFEPTRIGYIFDGWYTEENGGTKVEATTKVTTASDHTLYAHWTIGKYTVTYDQNDNYFSTTSQTQVGVTITYDQENSCITLNGTPTSSIITFQHFAQTYVSGDVYKLSVEYVSGDFTSTTNDVFAIEAKNANDGWLSTRTLTKVILHSSGKKSNNMPITDIVESEGKELHTYIWLYDYANATFNNYKIKVNITKVEEKEVTYNGTYGTLGASPTREGYTFDGWYTGENDGTKVESTTKVTTASDHTLYAHWTASKYMVTYNGNRFAIPSSETKGGVTRTYDPSTSYLTLDGTPTSNLGLTRMAETFTENQKYKVTLTYVSGSIAGKGKFTTEVQDASNDNLSTRNKLDLSLPSSGTATNEFAISSLGASDGKSLFYWMYFSDPSSVTFTNYKIKVNITKVEEKEVTYNDTYGTLGQTPLRTKHAFMGWYTAESGGTKVETTSKVTTASNHTLFAHWKKVYKDDANVISGADANIVTLSDRVYYKAYVDEAIAGYVYAQSTNGNYYTGPLLVGTTPESVAYYTSVNGRDQIFTWDDPDYPGGTFVEDGITYYYAAFNYGMQGDITATNPFISTIKKYSTETYLEAARMLLEDNKEQ